ncbi:hypothetical protein QOT17_008565 [Balamuthia mandrillaris]
MECRLRPLPSALLPSRHQGHNNRGCHIVLTEAWQKCSSAHRLSKYKQQTLRNKPQDIIAAFELAVLIELEFPQPSSKDKGHSNSPQSPLPTQ